ncbi:MAG: hypothetical protein EBU46_07585 [Nitrosomonadaceae bacterium]|nr:hypothetical protein [Nitrosomonadaceae bacterium]
METPINTLVTEMVNRLDDRLREDFEERAAIMEFDAKLPRAHAECLALLDVLHRHPALLTGVTVIQVEVASAIQCWATTDLESARQYLSDIGGIEMGMCSLADVINQQFNGIAVLSPIK